MPSTNKLNTSRPERRGYIAKFLYTFCGIFASFGVVTKALVAGIILLATFAIPVSITSLILSSNNAYATGNSSNSSSNTVSATLPGSVAIRLLNAAGTTEISSLDFNLTPTASGTSATQSMVVDVATSNPTGYKLYMQSDYKDSSNNYTNSLVHTTNHIPDSDIADTIPTYVPGSSQSGSGTNTLYWNYINPLTNAGIEDPSSRVASVIPAHGSPDKLDQYFTTTNSRQTEVSFNVSVDTTIVSGTYENQLLFSAVGNPSPVTYTVNFDADGGSPEPATISGSATSSTFSATIDSTAPVKTGYTFNYWSISVSSSNTSTDAVATCNGNNTCAPGDTLSISALGEEAITIELTAVYTINSHTVTIASDTDIISTAVSCDTGTGTGNSSNTCNYGDTVTISATAATGYTFDSSTGWTVNSGGVTITNSQFTMPDNNVAITASATKMYTYTLNLNKNDGTTDKQVLNYPASGGTANTTHTFTDLNNQAPSRTGYTFLGWATSSTGSSYVTSYTLDSSSASDTPTADGFPITGDLYAIWQKKTYTVTFSKSNISAPSAASTTIGYGDTITVSVAPGSGYYLSTASCSPSSSSNYTCSGVSTGTSQTGTQTMTIKNNNYDGDLIVTLAGTIATKYMQDSTYINECKNAATGTTFTLKDQRDNIDYRVRKLADGNCWMIDNLQFSQTDTLNSSTSDVPSGNTFALGSNSSFGTSCVNSPRWKNNTISDAYGKFYNWYAATAGSGTCSTKSGVNAQYSICPAGWRLPTGGSYNGEFYNLYQKYNSYNLMLNGDPSFVRVYWYDNSSKRCHTNDSGSSCGYYWSSTAYTLSSSSKGQAWIMMVSYEPSHNPAGTIDTGWHHYRYHGINMRCIAR